MKLPPTLFTPIRRDRWGGLSYKVSHHMWRELGAVESHRSIYFWFIILWAKITNRRISTYYNI